MHENAADGMHALPEVLDYAAADPLLQADRPGPFVLKTELSRILQHEDRAVDRGEVFGGRCQLTTHDIGFVDPLFRGKSIRGIVSASWTSSGASARRASAYPVAGVMGGTAGGRRSAFAPTFEDVTIYLCCDPADFRLGI
jgi:hypothetical protein